MKIFNKFEYLYIHWPFCRSKCYYCDFLSFCSKFELQQKYHETLISQLKKYKNSVPLKTIFIGGGTPSLYPLGMLSELFIALRKSFDFSHIKEITIEANPTDITKEKLITWRKLGINRLSMGIQVLDDIALRRVGRMQTVKQALNAIKIVPKYFNNISVDLILGLPGVSDNTWNKTLETVTSWPIKHLSSYILTQYKGTKLDYLIKKNEIFLKKDDKIEALYKKMIFFFEKHGFSQYEISNFAKKGFESIHNIAYWDRKPYLGIGLGASSFDGSYRFKNETNLNKFFKLTDGPLFGANKEKLTEQQVFLEELMLSLRQKKGSHLQRMLYFLETADEKIQFLENLDNLEKQGLIKLTEGRVCLTQKGLLLENEVVLKLI